MSDLNEQDYGNRVSTGIPGLDSVLRKGLEPPPHGKQKVPGSSQSAVDGSSEQLVGREGRGSGSQPAVDSSSGKLVGKDGLVVLIKGKAGCGKSTLALQMAVGLTASLRERGQGSSLAHYYTLEQNPQNESVHLAVKFADLRNQQGKQLPNLVSFNPNMPREDKSGERFVSDSNPLVRALDVLHETGKSTDAAVVVLDGLNAVPGDERRYIDFSRMVSKLRASAQFSIIAYEPSDGTGDDWIDYLVDTIIVLEADQHVGAIEYLLHRLTITKSRYQNAALGWHQYKIRKEGIEVYPSIHYLVHAPDSMKTSFKESLVPVGRRSVSSSTGNRDAVAAAIVEQVLGESVIELGSCTVLLGARGTYKSILCLDYLFTGAKQKEEGLLVSLIDNKDNVISQAMCPMSARGKCRWPTGTKGEFCEVPCGAAKCGERVFVFHQRPGCVAPPEFFHYLSASLGGEPDENAEKQSSVGKAHGRAANESQLQHTESPKVSAVSGRLPAAVAEGGEVTSVGDQPPEAKSTTLVEETANTIERRAVPIRRLAFWDLTQLEYRFPLFSDEKMFLPALVDLCKKRKVALLIMGAGNSALTRAASAMADNVIFCWRDEKKKGERLPCGVDSKSPEATSPSDGPYLAMYVDRRQGDLGKEGKALYVLELDSEGALKDLIPHKVDTASLGGLEYAQSKIRGIAEFQDIPASPSE